MSLNINGKTHADTISTTKKSAGNKDITSFLKKVKLSTKNKKIFKKLPEVQKKILHQGFINHKRKSFDRPQCILCGHVFSNEFLKTLRLTKHLTNVHLKQSKEKLDFFE